MALTMKQATTALTAQEATTKESTEHVAHTPQLPGTPEPQLPLGNTMAKAFLICSLQIRCYFCHTLFCFCGKALRRGLRKKLQFEAAAAANQPGSYSEPAAPGICVDSATLMATEAPKHPRCKLANSKPSPYRSLRFSLIVWAGNQRPTLRQEKTLQTSQRICTNCP